MKIIRNPKTYLIAPVLLSTGLLAGCHLENVNAEPVTSHTFDRANWQQLPAIPRPTVEQVTLVHTIQFAQGQSDLSQEERNKLFGFLQQNQAHDGVRIEIDGPRETGGYHDPLTAARLAAIGPELAGIGMRTDGPRKPATLLTRPDDQVTITLTRAMAILPDCEQEQPGFALKPRHDFGCANASALGQMVADPVDLNRGRALSPADGHNMARAVERLRKGDAEEIKSEVTK